MATDNKIAVYVRSAFTLKRNGHDPIKFVPGRNLVDAEAAVHPYVKAYLSDPAEAEAASADRAALDAAQNRIAWLEGRVSDLERSNASLVAYGEDLDRKVTQVSNDLKSTQSALDANKADLDQAHAALAAKEADMQALIDSMNAAAKTDTKKK